MSVSRSWTLGADPSCDVVVTQDYVSGRHCRLTQTATGFVLEDLGSTNGTWVNGSRIWSPQPVTRADTITLGKLTSMPWPAEASASAVLSAAPPTAPQPPGNVRTITVGRGPDNDVVLDYPTVSTHHARISIEGARTTIEDLGSTNGTFLHSLDNRITRAALGPNDTVYLGTQAVPASRLLGTAAPAANATMAVTPGQLAALVAAGGPAGAGLDRPSAAPPPKIVARPVAPPAKTSPPPAPPPPTSGIPMPAFWIGGAAVVAIGVFLAIRAGGPGTPQNPKSDSTKIASLSPDSDSTLGPNAASPTETQPKPGNAATSAGPIDKVVYAVLGERDIPSTEKTEGNASAKPSTNKVLGQLGTAAAIGEKTLVSSAEVAAQVQRRLTESWTIFVYSPSLKQDVRVLRATTHPEFQRAAAEAEAIETELVIEQKKLQAAGGDKAAGKEKKSGEDAKPLSQEETQALIQKVVKLEDRLLEAFERQIHFDVGILEVESTLPSVATVIGDAEPVEQGLKVRLVGLPHVRDQKETKRSEIAAPSELTECRYRERQALISSQGVKTQNVVHLRAKVPEEINWAGGLVVDVQNRLLGIVSRITPPLKAGEPPTRESVDVVPRTVWTSVAPAGVLIR